MYLNASFCLNLYTVADQAGVNWDPDPTFKTKIGFEPDLEIQPGPGSYLMKSNLYFFDIKVNIFNYNGN